MQVLKTASSTLARVIDVFEFILTHIVIVYMAIEREFANTNLKLVLERFS